MSDDLKGKRCVVLGANGFIGSALTRRLLREGAQVVACDRVQDFHSLSDHPLLECVTLDFLDEISVEEAVQGADWVFHLISTTKPASSNANMAYDVQSNVIPSIHLFEACARAGVQHVLFASSGGTVYGVPEQVPVHEGMPCMPIVSYGLTKLTIEHYARLVEREHGLRVTSLRIGNPFGPGHRDQQQGVIPIFLRSARQGVPLQIWGDGSVVRDYIYIDDVAEAFCAAARYRGPWRIFNIGSGEGRSLNEIVEALGSILGAPPLIERHPARPFDVPRLILNIDRARQELGWHPQTAFDEGLRRTWKEIEA
ncbi:MAG: NAD-dependent epimerase/dehydratase family protein [Halothiobacillaceae bacterium]